VTSPRDLRVLALGDSFVAGVGDPDGRGWFGRLVSAAGRRGVATTAYNLGVRRDTTGDVLARWHREVAVRRAPGCDERLVVSVGVNDCTVENGTQRVATEQSVADLARLLADAGEAGLPTFVVGPPPIADAEVNRRVVELSARFRDVCADAGAPFVEVVHDLVRDERWTAEVRDGDGAHPGAGGYERLAAVVLPARLGWIRP
jgi:lysophospholipase L1-like esterase